MLVSQCTGPLVRAPTRPLPPHIVPLGIMQAHLAPFSPYTLCFSPTPSLCLQHALPMHIALHISIGLNC